MFYGAKKGQVKIGTTEMDYVTFGKGAQPLVIIPGLSDGLRTVKGARFTIARMFRDFAKDFKVYVFSRKNTLSEGYSTRDMADDLKTAMIKTGISQADILGVSQGGMIGQHLAVDHPEMVRRLVLAVSVSRPNQTLDQTIGRWIDCAERDDYQSFFIDSIEKTYTEEKAKKYRPLYPILTRIGKPKSLERFKIQATACIEHNAYDSLQFITQPTLVIGGDTDHVVGKGSSEEMAERIKESKLVLYEGLGHGAFDEANDFNEQILSFLNR
ncbi:putative hydrolase [Alkalibacterium sp. AK22]|uniref:alpha/beta fold hydrolase n=1 Tax=Alkalibacterium sp. AK22 TaxID=1229520 RepID=UPI0004469791|nr:alpha/beta hydrolase [Alkalibacterium sp. AK22]EXJ22967.1 putative hydrolase [Alkalibacterium sp. AK22]